MNFDKKKNMEVALEAVLPVNTEEEQGIPYDFVSLKKSCMALVCTLISTSVQGESKEEEEENIWRTHHSSRQISTPERQVTAELNVN